MRFNEETDKNFVLKEIEPVYSSLSINLICNTCKANTDEWNFHEHNNEHQMKNIFKHINMEIFRKKGKIFDFTRKEWLHFY